MKKNIKILDANVIIRVLVEDNPKQLKSIIKEIESSSKFSLEIPAVVFCEIVFVLISVYNFKKTEVVFALTRLLQDDRFKLDRGLLSQVLKSYEKHNISIVDAYILEKAKKEQKQIYSYDRKLNNAYKKDV